MSEETARLPGFWRFVWLFWMQPITLHRLLRSLEVDPKESGWKLLRRRRSPSDNWWLVRSAQMFLLIAVPTVGLYAARGSHGDWLVASLVAALAWAVAYVVYDVAFGVAVVGVAVAVPVGLGGGSHGAPAVGPPLVVALVVAAVGMNFGVTVGTTFGVTLGRLPEAEGYSVNTVVAFLTALFRIPVYFFEIIAQMAARSWNSMTGRTSLCWAPVLHHEMSYLPHPFLESHLLAEADADPDLTRRVLDACSIAPRSEERRDGK